MHKAIIIARILWDRNKIIQPRLFKRDTRINVQNLETGNLWFESNSSFKEAQPKDLVNLLVNNKLL